MATPSNLSKHDVIAESFDKVPLYQSRHRIIFKGIFSPKYGQNRKECLLKIDNRKYSRSIPFRPPTLETYNIAKSLSRKFNSQKRHNVVDFAQTVIGTIDKSSYPTRRNYQEVCVVEEFLGTDFHKWCSNYGYIAPDENFLSGFAHWTWYESHGERMLLDLQGVKEDDKYVLVDPVLLSNTVKGDVYGPTDIGVEGMAMFFAKHVCSVHCIELPRPDLKKDFNVTWEGIENQEQLRSRTAYNIDMVLPDRDKHKMVSNFLKVADKVLDVESARVALSLPPV